MKPGPYLLPGLVGVIAIVGIGVLLARPDSQTPQVVSENRFEYVAFAEGLENRVVSQALEGGEASAVFGGLELDLRDAEIGGDQAVISVNAVFGGVQLLVPEHWRVESDVEVVVGGSENRARVPDAEDAKRLLVRGDVVFGGLDIRN